MKKRVLTMVLVLLFSMLLATNAFAGESSLLDMSLADSKLVEDLKVMEQSEESVSGEAGVLGPAPPITYLQVRAAISSDYPDFDIFTDNQLISGENHGGAEVYVITYEVGYGSLSIAKMNNGPNLSLAKIESVDLNSDGIIDAFYYWWDASAYSSGTFTYQDTSANYPYNTMYDSIYIQ